MDGEWAAAAAAPDSKERFAADLRRLRLDAGNPTLARLQGETGISRTVLSEAFTGRRLPSARTIDGIVRACGGDESAWHDRRDALAGVGRAVVESRRPDEAGAEADAEDADAPVDPRPARAGSSPASKDAAASRVPMYRADPKGTVGGVGVRRSRNVDVHTAAPPKPPRLRRRTAAWLAAGAFVVGALASGVTSALVVSNVYADQLAAARGPDGPLVVVETGEDPAMTECVDDAEVATGDTRADNSLLEIVWSDRCQAGWGRITRYDGLGAGNTVTIAIYPQTAPEGPARQEATEHDVQGAYTTLVVRPSPETLLCAEGSFTIDGRRIDLGDPLCI